jgi:fluoroacetyl-CoA thioesterase
MPAKVDRKNRRRNGRRSEKGRSGEDRATKALRVGQSAELTWTVTRKRTAGAVGHSSEVAVFATPEMGLLIEVTASKAVAGGIPRDWQHVGTLLQVRHLAATPVGFRVTARVRLAKIDGRRLTFEAEVFDDVGKVGAGIHQRAVVHWPTFLRQLEDRRGARSRPPKPAPSVVPVAPRKVRRAAGRSAGRLVW